MNSAPTTAVRPGARALPYSRQSLNAADRAAVMAVLESDWLTQGPAVPGFEAALCRSTGAKHAIAVTNATVGLELACRAIGLGPGDTFVTSPVTFIASAACGLRCGASLELVDIDGKTGLLDLDLLEARLQKGLRPKLVIPVHLAGQPLDVSRLGELAEVYGFHILEDAAHSLGATWRGEAVGCGAHAAATVFSFHPVKMVTTGEGGAIMTGDDELASRLRQLRCHGMCSPENNGGDTPTPLPLQYQISEVGTNARMSDLQAALGASQLHRLPDFLSERRRLAACYDQLFSDKRALPLQQASGARSSYHLYVVRLPKPFRDGVYRALREAGYGVNLHYAPLPCHPLIQRLGFEPDAFPAARAYGETALSLPLFPGMPENVLELVTAIINEVCEENGFQGWVQNGRL